MVLSTHFAKSFRLETAAGGAAAGGGGGAAAAATSPTNEKDTLLVKAEKMHNTSKLSRFTLNKVVGELAVACTVTCTLLLCFFCFQLGSYYAGRLDKSIMSIQDLYLTTKHIRTELPQWVSHSLDSQRQRQEDSSHIIDHDQTRYYHEFLVHPAMLSHDFPKVVAIVTTSSTKEKGLLHQVQQHKSVETIASLVLDSHDDRVDSELHDSSCSIVPNAQDKSFSCTNDSFFHNNNLQPYVKKLEELKSNGRLVDVVIMDPRNSNKDHHQQSHTMWSPNFWNNYLSPDGVMVTSLWPSAGRSFIETIGETATRMENAGFEKMISYETRLPRAFKPTYFVLSLNLFSTLARWHQNEALMELELHRRLIAPLDYFDGASWHALEYPSKRTALEYCQLEYSYEDEDEDSSEGQESSTSACVHGYDPYSLNIRNEELRVQKSGIADHAGRGLYTMVDVPANSYINLENSAHPVRLHWTTTEIVSKFRDITRKNTSFLFHPAIPILHYYDAYGYADEVWGKDQFTVESSTVSFMNHGCNGTSNVGGVFPYTESNWDLTRLPEDYDEYNYDKSFYDPLSERQYGVDSVTTSADQDIAAGEELLCNYFFFSSKKRFYEYVSDVRHACNGALGPVERHQKEKNRQDTNS